MRVREARQGAIHFEHVTDGDDALRGVGAIADLVEPAERVLVQAKRQGLSKPQALSEGADSRWQKASTRTWTWTWGEKHALELAKRAVGLEHFAESDEAAHLAIPADAVVLETVRQKQALSTDIDSEEGQAGSVLE